MQREKSSRKFKSAAVVIAAGMGVAALVAALTVSPHRADATPAIAQSTGKACGACHKNPAGGGPLTAAGKAYQKK
jgi:cytochrome c556